MKSLGKLKINSAKMLNNEDLINLKGGYGSKDCSADCSGSCTIDDGNGHYYAGYCEESVFPFGVACACIQI